MRTPAEAREDVAAIVTRSAATRIQFQTPKDWSKRRIFRVCICVTSLGRHRLRERERLAQKRTCAKKTRKRKDKKQRRGKCYAAGTVRAMP